MYVFMCLLIIGMNIEKVPSVFWWVISDAFQPTAATGGFVGATVTLGISGTFTVQEAQSGCDETGATCTLILR